MVRNSSAERLNHNLKQGKRLKGKHCSLEPFSLNNETIELIHSLFSDKVLHDLINPDYPLGKSKRVISLWVRDRVQSESEEWYIIRSNNAAVGYVAYKWKVGLNLACEISTALLSSARGFKIGFESSKLIIDYIRSQRKFRHITAFCRKSNYAAIGNLRKLGFRKSNRLHIIVESELYNEKNPDPENSLYQLMSYNTKRTH
ncbi:MAG: Acetyltransferase (GNAT) family protein [Chlorobi bacterium OLB4]|nr:MAG: Acetyltransferase (GNAT) family protein [Chlorobi bacterium OLB4]OQY77091.1 MAG: hypothetical protein B6D43_08250 [Ignavibacteriales bacterium UTCHB1]